MLPESLLKQPCECVYCNDCKGKGNTWNWGTYGDDEFVTCDTCDGHGITEKCDRCHSLDEIEELNQ